VLVELNIELAKSCASTAMGRRPARGSSMADRGILGSRAARTSWASQSDAVACGSYAPATKAIEAEAAIA